MKQVAVLLLCLVAVALGKSLLRHRELDDQWEAFKKTYGKQYQDQHEEAFRRRIWEFKVHRILSHNLEADLGQHSFRLGLNEYADLTDRESTLYLRGYRGRHLKQGSPFSLPEVSALPKTVDWRNKGYVTPIKNQAQCGSCWAFSATGSLEGQHFKKTGKLVSLSEQNLMDCSGKYGNMGCEGGLMDSAFQYIRDNKGIDTEASYPYEAQDDTCRFKPKSVGATLTSYVDIPSKDESALQKAVATVGPISVAIDASSFLFQLYDGGIYDDESCSEDELDHGVLVVGYGTENGQDYWLVKNSWGTSWGIDGYIKMSRNKNNQCGIATNASYPVV